MIAMIMIGMAIVVAYYLGFAVAHHTIAMECERLGGFFVGKKVYKCVGVENSKTKENEHD